MKTVLIVEDAALIRELVEAVLRREGYRTLVAADGQEALAQLAAETPDLILLDLGLPAVDGRTLLARIRASERLGGVPVLVLTAAPDRERVREVAALGVSGYLLKSEFSLEQLLERVRRCVERPTPGEGDARAAGGEGPARATAAAAGESLESLRPLATRSEVLLRLKGCAELRALSPAAAKVLELTRSPGCSMESLARVVAQDHAMAIKLLKLANSAAFAQGEPADSVQKAVVRIGVEGIRQSVLSLAVVDRFTAPLPGAEVSMLEFWEHGIAVATIVAELARADDPRQAESAFTAGLLHDVGRLLYAEQLGGLYAQVIAAARRLDAPLERAEARMLLLSHAEAVERVLVGWNFAKELVRPIVLHHHEPDEARALAPRQAAEAIRLGLADRLAHALLLGCSGNDTLYPTEAHCRALGIDGAALARALTDIRSKTEEMKLAMLAAAASPAPAPPVLDQVRARLATPLRTVYASAAPELDAFHLFFEAISEPPVDDAQPNLAVAHITAAREQAEVASALESALHRRGGTAPPLLVLTPEWMPPLQGQRWPVPPACVVTTPVSVARLLDAVNTAVATMRPSEAA